MDPLAQDGTAGSGRRREERQLSLFRGQHELARAEFQRQDEVSPELGEAFAWLRRRSEALDKKLLQQGERLQEMQNMIEQQSQRTVVLEEAFDRQEQRAEEFMRLLRLKSEEVRREGDQKLAVLKTKTADELKAKAEELVKECDEKLSKLKTNIFDELEAMEGKLREEGSKKLAAFTVAFSDELKVLAEESGKQVSAAIEKQHRAEWDLRKHDFSNYKEDQSLMSPDFELAGLKLKLQLYPQGDARGSPGQCSLFLHAPPGVALKYRLTLDKRVKAAPDLDEFRAGKGWGWLDFAPAGDAFGFAAVELLGVRRTLAEGVTASWP